MEMKMIKKLLIVLLTIASFVSIKAQEPTLLGTEQIFSLSQSKLIGSVRTVLSVQKRDIGGIAKTFSTVTDSYDLKGTAVESLFHQAEVEIHSGKLVRLDQSSYYFYDLKGKLVKRLHYEPDGSAKGKDEYTYDNSGRLVEIIRYSGEKTLLEKNIITYEPERRQTTVKRYFYYDKDREPSIIFFVYTFNEKGQAVEQTTLKADRSLNHRVKYYYDEKDNLVKEATYNEKDVYTGTHQYTYKFDIRGNWVERVDIYTKPNGENDLEDNAWMVTYRVITYYGQGV
jgi:hypothetical protein